MFLKLLKKVMSLALAFAVALSLSCCGVSDEVLIDEINTETTPEETTLTIPDEATILASLTDEEKEVWLSMPDIVTMRVLYRYDKDDNFLYMEIIYIDKIGQTKKIISYYELKTNNDEESIEWLNDKISQNENAELIDVVDIHTLIEFYNTFMCVDSDSKWAHNHTVGLAVEIERHYGFLIFGTRTNLENGLETLLISYGDAGHYYLRRNDTNERGPRDESGRETFDLYLLLDPFMVDIPGGIGHLTGEEG